MNSRPADEDYPALPWRRRLLIAGLAVATAVAVVLTMLERPGAVMPARAVQPDAPRCDATSPSGSANSAGATGCTGGRAEVFLVAPAAAPASGPR